MRINCALAQALAVVLVSSAKVCSFRSLLRRVGDPAYNTRRWFCSAVVGRVPRLRRASLTRRLVRILKARVKARGN